MRTASSLTASLSIWPGGLHAGWGAHACTGVGVCVPRRCACPGDVHAWGACMVGHMHAWGCMPMGCAWHAHPPPVDRILDTCLWKHYLPATTVADDNNSQTHYRSHQGIFVIFLQYYESHSWRTRQFNSVSNVTFQIYRYKVSDLLPELGNTAEDVGLRLRTMGHDIYYHMCESRIGKKQRAVDRGPVCLE